MGRALLWCAILALFVLVLCSLGMNGLLLGQLYFMQQGTATALDEGLVALEDLKDETITYTVSLSQTVPVNADVPFKKQFNVQLQTTVPINTEIEVPIETPLRTFVVKVPIHTQVPVNTTVPVQIDQTLHIVTEVPLRMEVPIVIEIRKTPLIGYLERLQGTLRQLRDSLRGTALKIDF
ncbi:MAG: hypothetical protein KKA73_05440 [Chloroflexi bacterium]|nr:hypothetical protein [Chloroflexota bacterium]MBU1747111.1 hypothetical protein [Chloroflexota bacterium]